ncbi:MAG TPA: NAD/NADP octopine/nopaline dehydrogenase family protein [Armatimonadota bacterium]|nr:NAD/NADP octopine/nopaline dehydrogenase family protein [Armatimonadota bacterium]HOM80912.1 NAD/NADP octopine/nopaline dehydrogenase family protein [Armatimonadota bacterium]HPO74942.1 NAD/NADP octopine/nopaline dehydrogenase family protein [Armatimonadota bacterium]HPT98168.1 NAD/NADP octopine/nopaline dehydrogenase family protein [Armatimonadota bacterium]
MFDTIAVIGAGNGGKASAADLALQGKRVRLFELPEYAGNLEAVAQSRRLIATGAVAGEAELERATTELEAAISGAELILVCTQAPAHDRVARILAPLVRPEQVVVLSPGSTGGTLHFANVFRQMGVERLPILVELSTLPYGCRASGESVRVFVKVGRVKYGVLPGRETERIGPALEALYPGFVRSESVLEAGLNNGNPVIHPAVTLLNAARIEKEGTAMYFYRDGVSPAVARAIEALDGERMALLRALGYPAQPEPLTCVQQGYATASGYLECYSQGPGFIDFRSPDTLDHRYLHEDIGMGLLFYTSLGRLLGVPTSLSDAFVTMGSALSGIDYRARNARSLESLGLSGITVEALKEYLQSGILPPGA